MGSEATRVKCGCGHTFPAPSDPAVKAVCPACKREVTTGPSPAVSQDAGLETILVSKGWATPDQIKAALEKRAAEAKEGRSIRLGEALVALGVVKPEQIREALAVQGKVTMRCPACKKAYNVRSPKPGQRVMCKTCRVPLEISGSITDLHAEDAVSGFQSAPVGEAVDAVTADLIPGYVLERRIATGGMGEVYLGLQRSLDRAVAVKILSPDLARDQTYVQRFLAEARAAGKLNHENIVGAVDAGQAQGRTYFVMEYIQGDTLQAVVKREGGLSERRALEIARQIARGLRQAHQQGLIHRDIKSANIMIGMDGVAKICDFGLARDIKSDTTLTQPGMVHSSPAYASPEQCRGAKLDHRSDMYSLGVTLFEILTGQLPFRSDTSSALFVAHVTQSPPSPRSLKPSITNATSQLILRLLRKTPEGRFKDYDELLAAIDQAEKPESAPIRTSPQGSAAAPPRGLSAPKIALAGAALVLVVIGLILAFKGGSGKGGSETGGSDTSIEKMLREAKAFENTSWGNPPGYPAVRARWKGLVERFRGTPQHNQFAGPLLEFEARVAQEADRAAFQTLENARPRLEDGRLAEALALVRAYPDGYEGTPGAGRIGAFVIQIEKDLDQRFEEGKKACWSLVATEKFDDAKKRLDGLRSIVTYHGVKGATFSKPVFQQEFESLERKLEEERLFARRREAEGRPKETPAPTNPEVRPTPPVPVNPPAVNPPPAQPTPVFPANPPPKVTAQPSRLPAPAAAAQKNAEKLVRDLFKDEYLKKLPSEKTSLARQLMQLARQTKDDPAGKFVLYREARDLAAQGGDPALASQAIDELAREYAIDVASMKGVVLAELTRNAKTPEEFKGAVLAFLSLADEAIAAEDYEAADRAAAGAAQMARRAKDIPLVAKADAKARECASLKARFETLTKGKEALAKNPDDPAGNLSMGQYLCFLKGDWETGLKHLAKGSDAALKALATRDLANPSEGAEPLALGDAWWDLAEKSSDAKDAIRKRAASWYGRALPKLTGIHKTRVEKRLQEAGAMGIDLLALVDPAKDSVEGTWAFSGPALVSPVSLWARIQIPYVPPDEYDLVIVVERKEANLNFEIGLATGGRQFHVGIDGWNGGSISGLNLIDSKPGNMNETTFQGKLLQKDVPATFLCSVRRTGVSASVNGNNIFGWKGDLNRLSAGGTWKMPRSDTLFLGSYTARFHIHKIMLLPVSGQGRRLRE